MKVIGVDPGSRVCGFGVVEASDSTLIHIESGQISIDKGLPLYQKLDVIYERLVSVINSFKPDLMSIETAFYSKNALTAIRLGEARGAALLAAAHTGLGVYEYTPSEVKLALTGNGRAGKGEVQKMVSMLLNIDSWDSDDVSDAVAISICHLNSANSATGTRTKARYGRSRRKKRFTLNDIPAQR